MLAKCDCQNIRHLPVIVGREFTKREVNSVSTSVFQHVSSIMNFVDSVVV
jgi:hypothetical protein